ncbi:MAG: PLP-dependent transferase, partial [Candidatus Binatia bacterium]
MAKPSYRVRPETAVLTRGFDPRLSVGAARPPVYRTSTFVFSSPEAAERAFAIALGRVHPQEDEDVDLIYSRLSHPNAEILEDQLVPLERGAKSAAVFNSGMAAISTILLTLVPRGGGVLHTRPLYGGTQHFLHQVMEPLGFEV